MAPPLPCFEGVGCPLSTNSGGWPIPLAEPSPDIGYQTLLPRTFLRRGKETGLSNLRGANDAGLLDRRFFDDSLQAGKVPTPTISMSLKSKKKKKTQKAPPPPRLVLFFLFFFVLLLLIDIFFFFMCFWHYFLAPIFFVAFLLLRCFLIYWSFYLGEVCLGGLGRGFQPFGSLFFCSTWLNCFFSL